jgi:hypothetical protein
MNFLLKSLTLWPLWAQVSIRDFGTLDYPEGNPEEEGVVASSGHIYVPTRSDSDGQVNIEISAGATMPENSRLVYEGILTLESGVLCVTPPAMEDEETLHMPRPGDWSVRIAVRGEPRADFVAIVFDEGQWLKQSTSTGTPI